MALTSRSLILQTVPGTFSTFDPGRCPAAEDFSLLPQGHRFCTLAGMAQPIPSRRPAAKEFARLPEWHNLRHFLPQHPPSARPTADSPLKPVGEVRLVIHRERIGRCRIPRPFARSDLAFQDLTVAHDRVPSFWSWDGHVKIWHARVFPPGIPGFCSPAVTSTGLADQLWSRCIHVSSSTT